MPIKIEHGGQGGTVAGQLISQGGLANLQRQLQERMQMRQLTQQAVQAGLNRSASGAGRGGVRYGGGGGGRRGGGDAIQLQAMRGQLAERLGEQEFERAMQMKQEEARAKADQFELEYSTKTKQEIAKINQAMQAVASAKHISPEEKERMNLELRGELAGKSPGWKPRDPRRETFPKGPDGEEQNGKSTWIDPQTGAYMGFTQRNGVSTPSVLIPYEDLPEQVEAVRQNELKLEAIKIQAKREDTETEMAFKFQLEDRKAYMNALSKMFVKVPAGHDEKGKALYDERPLLPTEFDQAMKNRFGSPQSLGQPQAQQIPVVDTDEQYEALPPGAEFTDSSGRRFTKPESRLPKPIPFLPGDPRGRQ